MESVTILKDAASASIYGARGVFGVVLITTKKAEKGRTSISYSSNYAIKSPLQVPDFVTDGYTWAKMFSEAFVNGDRVRLADTELFIEIEHDYATYGEEVKFGGGKVIRDGMGQSQRCAAEFATDTAYMYST